jgi:hypothetical protein
MSKITTRSKFYYGHRVTILNRSLDFKEGAGPELQATLKVGDYTITEFALEVARAMNVAGSQTYTVTFDRDNRLMEISAAAAFTVLFATGSRVGTSVGPLLGMGADIGPLTTITASAESGKAYRTQYPVDKYLAPEHNAVKESSSVNVSAVGVTQLITFGDGLRIEMDIRVITNKTGLKNSPFLNNSNGIADALDFMSYIISKSKVEFMPDVDDSNNFVKLILESTPDSKNGTEFSILNMKTPDVYRTGVLIFRKVLA